MARPVRIPAQQQGFEKSVMDAVNRLNRSGQLKLNVNSRSFTQPLGKITASADEFTKSLEASNARVIAFGASVGIINAVSNAFKSLVIQTMEVQKQMAEINVVMQTGTEGLQKMQTGLFKIAKETAQSFSVVTEAALEFSRQGLSMEKTLLATKQAMILTRITALDAAEAVKGLTAAVNGFVDAGISHTQVVNKMSAVDVNFAVSTEDLIHGLERAGAVAQDAKVNFDELMGAITAAQQITARGGNVIGNSFKTIFTRIQRSSTINRLEELGIAVKDLEGRTLPAMKILKELAITYDGLADSTKAAVAEQVGGVFQINILKAALKDLGRENSVFARATEISNRATDEATKKNEALNKTLSALAAQTGTSIQQLSEAIGKLSMGGGIEKVLKTINTIAEGMFKGIESEGIGGDLARGLLKGMGNILSGPGLILVGGMFVKLFGEVTKFATKSMANIIGITTQKQKQKAVEEAILKVMMENEGIEASLLAMGKNRVLQEEHVLKLIKQQAAAARERAAIAAAVAPGLVRSGVKGPSLSIKGGAAGGIIPASERNAERKGAISAGYSPGKVSSTKIKGVGDVVYNKAESIKEFPGMQQKAIMPPESSRAGSKYAKAFKKAHGFDPYAPSGFIPNYGIVGARGSASLALSRTNMVTHGTGRGQNTRAMDKKYGESGEKLFATETARFVNKNTPEEKRNLLGRIMTRLLDKGIVNFTRPGYFQKESFKTNRRSSEKDFDQFERHMVKQLSSEGYKSTGRVIDPKTRKVEAGNNQYPQDAFAKGKVPREFKINRIDEKDILSKSIRRTTDLDPQDILNGKYTRGDITKGNEFIQVLRNNFGPSSGNHDEILMGLVNKFQKSNLDSALNLLRQKKIDVPAGEEAYTAAIHGLHRGFIPNYIGRRRMPSKAHLEKAKKSIDIYRKLTLSRKRSRDYDGNLATEISNAWGLKDPTHSTIVKTFGRIKTDKSAHKTVNEEVLDIMANPAKYKDLFKKNNLPAPDWSASQGKSALNLFTKEGKFGTLDKVKMGQKSKLDGDDWEQTVRDIFKKGIKSGSITDLNTIKKNFPLDFKGDKGFLDATLNVHKLRVMHHKIARTLAQQNPSALKRLLLKGKDFDGVEALGGLAEISKVSSGIRSLSRMKNSRSLFPEGKFVGGVGQSTEDFSRNMQKWYDGLTPAQQSTAQSSQMSGSWKVQSPQEYQMAASGFVPNFIRMINPSKDRSFLLKMWQDKLKKAKSISRSGKPRIETDPQVSKLNAEANHIWDQIQLLKKGKPYSIPNFANISKIRELAKRGKGGEKANAQRMLEKFSIKSKGMFDDMIIDDFLRDPKMSYKGPWGDTVTDYLLSKGYDKNQILKASKSPSSYARAAGGVIPNFVRWIKNPKGGKDLPSPDIDPRTGRPSGIYTSRDIHEMKAKGYMRTDEKGWHYVGKGKVKSAEAKIKEERRLMAMATIGLRGSGKAWMHPKTGKMYTGSDHQQIAADNGLFNNGMVRDYVRITKSDRSLYIDKKGLDVSSEAMGKLKNIAQDDYYKIIEDRGILGEKVLFDPKTGPFSGGHVPNFAMADVIRKYQSRKSSRLNKDQFNATSAALTKFNAVNGLFARTALAGTSRVRLTERNFNKVRQFINSKEFRQLDKLTQNKVLVDLKSQSQSLGLPDVTRGYGQHRNPLFEGRIAASSGLIPNFSNPLSQAISREKAAGVPENMIRISQSDRLKGPKNPSGLAVINTRDEPMGINQGINRSISMGIDPKSHGASQGVVPNFTNPLAPGSVGPAGSQLSDILKKIGVSGNQLVSILTQLTPEFNKFRANLSSGGTAANQHARKVTSMISSLGLEEAQTKQLMREFSNLGTTANTGASKLKSFISQLGAKLGQGPLGQAASDVMKSGPVQAVAGSGGMFSMFNQGLQGNVTPSTSRAGRAGQAVNKLHGKVSSPGMQMGMMMAPMMTEMMAESIRGNKPKYERSKASRATTGAISGLGDIAMYTAMGSMFGPWGTAIGAAVGATIALTKVFNEASLSLEDIQQRNASYAAEMQKVTGSIQGYEKSVAAVNQARKSGNFNATVRASQNEMNARADLRLSMGSSFADKYIKETDKNKKAELALKAFDAQAAVSSLASSEELIKGLSEQDLAGWSLVNFGGEASDDIRQAANDNSKNAQAYQSAENSMMRAGRNLQSLEGVLDDRGKEELKDFFNDDRFNRLATGTGTGPSYSNDVAEDMAEELSELMLRLQGNIDDDIGGENLALIQKQLRAFSDTIGDLDESDEIQATFGNLKKGMDLRVREELDLRSKHARQLMQEFNRFERQLSVVFADITHQFKSIDIMDGAISAGQRQSSEMMMRSVESTGMLGLETQARLRGSLQSDQISSKYSQEISGARRDAQLGFSKQLSGKNFSEALTGSLGDPSKSGKTMLPKVMGEFLKDSSQSIEEREKLMQGEITDGFKNFVLNRTEDLNFKALKDEIESEGFSKIDKQISDSEGLLAKYRKGNDGRTEFQGGKSESIYRSQGEGMPGVGQDLINKGGTVAKDFAFKGSGSSYESLSHLFDIKGQEGKGSINNARIRRNLTFTDTEKDLNDISSGGINYFNDTIKHLIKKSLGSDPKVAGFENVDEINQAFDDFMQRKVTETATIVGAGVSYSEQGTLDFSDVLNDEIKSQVESIRQSAIDKIKKGNELDQIKSMLDPSSDGFSKDIKEISESLKTTDVGKELFKSLEELDRVQSLLKQRMAAEEALLKQQTEFAIAQAGIMDASQAQIREAQRSLSRVELNNQGQFVNKGIEAEKRALKAANARELEMSAAQANYNNIGLTSGSKEFLATRAVEDKRKLQEPALIAKETEIASEKINQLFTPEKYATLLPPALELGEVAKERAADLERQRKDNEKNIEIFKRSFRTVMGVAEDAEIEGKGGVKAQYTEASTTDKPPSQAQTDAYNNLINAESKRGFLADQQSKAGGPHTKVVLDAMNSYQEDITAYNDSFKGISDAFKNAPRDNEKDLSAAVEGLKASIGEEILKFYSKDTAFGTKDQFQNLLKGAGEGTADYQALQVANNQFQSNKEAFITKNGEANIGKLGENFEDMLNEATTSVANLREAFQQAGKDASAAEKEIALQRIANDKAATAATKLAARTRSVADSMTDLGSALSHINELSLQFIQASLDTDMGQAGMTSSQISKRQRDFDLIREVSQGRDQLQRQSKEATSSFISQIQGLDIDDSIKKEFLGNFDNKETKAGIVNAESFKAAAENVLSNTNFYSDAKFAQGVPAFGKKGASEEDINNFANNTSAREALRAEIEKSTNAIKLNEQTIGREVSYRQRLNSLLDQNARYMQSFGAGVSGAMSSIKERLENFRRTEGETLVSSMNEGFKRNAMGDYGEGESFFSIINDRNREIVAQRNADAATNIVFGDQIGKTLEAFGVEGAAEKYDMGKFWDPEGNEQKRANEKMLTSFNETGSLGDDSLDFLRSDLLSSKDIQAVTADNTRKMVELLQSMKEQGFAGGNMGDGSTVMSQETATKEGQQRMVGALNNQTKQDATNTDSLKSTVTQSSSDSAGVISTMLGSAIGTFKSVSGINNDFQSGQWGDAGRSVFDGARAATTKVGDWLDDDEKKAFRGGYISRFNFGGRVPQFGGDHNTDNVPALLTGGEYVIRKDSVEKYGKDYFEKLNKGLIPKEFEDGGDVKKAERSWLSKKITKMQSNFSNEMNQFKNMKQGMEASEGSFASMFGSGKTNRRSKVNMGMTKNEGTGSFWTQPKVSKDDFGNDVVELNSDLTGPAETEMNWSNIGNAAQQGLNLVGNVAKGYQNYKQGKKNRAAELAKARAQEDEKRRKRDYQLLKPLEYYDMAATQIDLGGLSGKSSIDQGKLRLSAAAMTGQIQGDRYGTLLVNVQRATHQNKINDRLFDIEYAKQAAYAKAVDKYEKKKMIADSLIQVGGSIASFAGAGQFMQVANMTKDLAGGAQALFGVQDRSQVKPASLSEVMKQSKERREDFSGPAMDIHQYGSFQRLQQRYANVKSGSTSGADLYLGGFELTQPGQRVRNPALYGKTRKERQGKFLGGLIKLAGGGTVNYDASRVTRSSRPDVAGSERSGRAMTGYDTKGRDIYNSFAMGGQVPTLQKKDISIGHDLIDRISTPDSLNLNLDDFEVQEVDNAFQLPDSILNSVSNKGSVFNPAIISTMAKGFDYLASRKQKGGDITAPLDPMGMLALALGGVVNSSKKIASSVLGLAKGGLTNLKIKPDLSTGVTAHLLSTYKNSNRHGKAGADSMFSQLGATIKTAGLRHNNENQTTGKIQKSHILSEKALGGPIELQALTKYSSGGNVTGGSGVRDDVPALLSEGEYVIRKSSAQKYGANFLNQLNAGTKAVSRFAEGGAVGETESSPSISESKEVTHNISQNFTFNISKDGSSSESEEGDDMSENEREKEFGRRVRVACLKVIEEERRIGGLLH